MNKFIIQAFTFSLCFCFCISASCSNETDDLMEILKGDSVIESSTKVPLVLNISCFRGDCATVLCSVHGEIQKTEKTLNMTITLPLCNISKFADISMKSKKISLNDTFKKLYSDKKLTIESKMTESVNDKVNWNTSLSIKVNGNLSLNYNLEFNNITVCLAQKTTLTAKTTKSVTTPNKVTTKPTLPATKSTTPATTSKKPTTTPASITTSTKAKPMSTSVTTPKKPQTGKSTPKVSNTTKKASKKSKPPIGRIVLLVAAILILIGVVAIAIYCRKRKRLSNQPAYYNDIAINDPLRDEFDDQHDYTDDDELPLFS